MNLIKILRKLSRPIALLLAIVMSTALLGCTESDVGEILDIAVDVLEMLDDTSLQDESITEPPTQTESQTVAQTEAAKTTAETKAPQTEEEPPIDEDGRYYSKDDVALYIHTYGKLPKNFITKSEAGKLGWEGGSVEKYAEGCAIGGDKFGNREEILPKKNGRTYTECDIDTLGKSSRGAKRIVFSNDGLIYYTDDHYETFTLLYGEE